MSDIITKLFRTVARRPEIQGVVPMGYTPGLPVITERNGELCVDIPFLRYKVTGKKDETLVFPIRYVASYVLPERQLVSFLDLKYTTGSADTDFDKAIGIFRHEAVADLNRKEYNELRASVLAGLDSLTDYMLGDGEFDTADDKQLGAGISRLLEPSLYPFYKAKYPNFYKKYITHGKNR